MLRKHVLKSYKDAHGEKHLSLEDRKKHRVTEVQKNLPLFKHSHTVSSKDKYLRNIYTYKYK